MKNSLNELKSQPIRSIFYCLLYFLKVYLTIVFHLTTQ